MSRRKRVKKVRKSINEDTHHILYTKRGWNRGYNKELRNHWYMRVIIPKNTLHKRIHNELKSITPPRGLSSKFALQHLAYLEGYGVLHPEDSLEKRLTVLIALFDGGTEVDTIRDLKAQLAIATKFYHRPP